MRVRHTRKGLVLLLCLVAVAPVARAAEDVFTLMGQRLELMRDVAAYKWHHDQPIDDPQREDVVVAEAAAEALRHGLVPATVEALFRAQIEAAKAVQRYWFEQWGAERAAAPPARDLAGTVRPELSRLGTAIVAAAAARPGGPGAGVGPVPAADALPAVLGLDADHRQALVSAVRGVRAFPNRLAQIRATGTLRVGTTGDYAPFSHREPGASQFVGVDVDLARDLAAALGVEAEFVLTSWPGLLDDLAGGDYDIAMSGVSRTLGRQQIGFLTQPYHADGKTPIGRCADRARFESLDRIDQAEVKVVVNPGGTNERFVDERVHRAQKLLHADNRTIFGELVAGRADVMFTDRIEVDLQARRHPELCALLADDLTYQEKSYLLPQDPTWLEFVDTWLALRLAEGAVDAVFAAHGVARGRPR